MKKLILILGILIGLTIGGISGSERRYSEQVKTH